MHRSIRMISRDVTVRLLALAIFAVFLVACAPAGEADAPLTETAPKLLGTSPSGAGDPPTTEQAETPGVIERRPVPTLPGGLERVELTPGQAVAGEVPGALLNEIIADLANDLGVDPNMIAVVVAQFVEWNDGSLGCPQPGQYYTQAIVPGYQVIVEYEGTSYDYRASESGNFFLCQRPALKITAIPGDPDLQPPTK